MTRFAYAPGQYWLPSSGAMSVWKILHVHRARTGATFVTACEGEDGDAFTWKQLGEHYPAHAGSPALVREVAHPRWSWTGFYWAEAPA